MHSPPARGTSEKGDNLLRYGLCPSCKSRYLFVACVIKRALVNFKDENHAPFLAYGLKAG